MPTYMSLEVESSTVTRTHSVTNMTSISDIPLANHTKNLLGRMFDTSGVPVAGATALLFRQSDHFFVDSVTTDANGWYVFPRDSSDSLQYYVVGFSVVGGVTHIHGTSNPNLVPG